MPSWIICQKVCLDSCTDIALNGTRFTLTIRFAFSWRLIFENGLCHPERFALVEKWHFKLIKFSLRQSVLCSRRSKLLPRQLNTRRYDSFVSGISNVLNYGYAFENSNAPLPPTHGSAEENESASTSGLCKKFVTYFRLEKHFWQQKLSVKCIQIAFERERDSMFIFVFHYREM